MAGKTPSVGVLGLQGDIREHVKALQLCEVDVRVVRRASEINQVDALVLPGGESTAIVHLAKVFDLFEVIKSRISDGLPVYGSCAGMILLADRVLDAAPGQETFGGLDITVRRNAFGRQVDSFESDLEISGLGEHMRAVFIRAPWVEATGPDVQVLASVMTSQGVSHPVAVLQNKLLATSFHPELTQDNRLHRYFLTEVCGWSK